MSIKENKKETHFGKITENISENSKNNIIQNENKLVNSNNNNIGVNKIIDKKDFELNSLEYEDAIKLDIRNLFQFYISLIKNNHPIMFSFSFYSDYNPNIIKLFLFSFLFPYPSL